MKEGKTPAQSRTEMSHMVLPEDANAAGNVHGGVILKHIDTAAGIVAFRHARSNVVTVSIDRVDFMKPVHVGELLTFRALLHHAGKSSMEISVDVWAENVITGVVRHTNRAFLTFVALGEDGKPTPVPPLILETDDDRRRFAEAKARREMRLRERVSESLEDNIQ